MLIEEKGLVRFEGNPLLIPEDFPGADAVFNCGQTMYQGKTILLVAIIKKDGNKGMYVAESEDGLDFNIRSKPLISESNQDFIRPLDTHPIDPRITYFPEEDVYYIMRPGNSRHGCVAFLGKTEDWETYEDIEVIALPDNRVPCLFPEKIDGYYVRLDRPYTLIPDPHHENQRGHIWISYSPDLIHWGQHRPILTPWAPWNNTKIGPTPPIKTDEGWLEIIHGVSTSCTGARYSIGAILLDLENPQKVIGKANSYILTPDTEYEFMGRTPNVVFPCGAIADPKKDELRIYYGGADTCIALASGSLSEIVRMCKKGF